jgi:hypothetical protein
MDDLARWRAARTLTDLGELTAQWLNGAIAYTPTYCGPESETTPLIPVLAACNRAGFVTTHSQPGEALDEHGGAQRADVSGFASSKTFARLMAAVADADLIITAARAAADEDLGPFINITLDEGDEFTWDGGAMTQRQIEAAYRKDCPDAVEALCRAWQVTLIDPQWGRNDVLWPMLARFAGGRP